MFALHDHPQIRWCERTGYPSWAQERGEEEEEIHLYNEEEEEDDEN